MWQGTFEAEDCGDGRKSYHLRWQTTEQVEEAAKPLTESEMRAGLFVKYLIEQGKIGG